MIDSTAVTDPFRPVDTALMAISRKAILALIWSVGLFSQSAMTTDEHLEVSTPDGSFQAQKSNVEQTQQTISAIDSGVLAAIDQNASLGPMFVREFLALDGDPSLQDFDEAFRLWQSAFAKGDTDIEGRTVVDIFGSILGNKLAEDLNMEWVTVSDEYGTDYAVVHRDLQVFSYPFSTVQKRVDSMEYGFMNNVYYMVKQMIESGDYAGRDKKAEKQ